jgi:hypothetical protein
MVKKPLFVCNLLMQQKNAYLFGLFCAKMVKDRVFSTAENKHNIPRGI